MDAYQEMAEAIIKKQILVLGQQIAIERAKKVSGIAMDESGNIQSIGGNGLDVVEKLIETYQELLGPAGLSFAKDAAEPIIKNNPGVSLPKSLQ